MRWTAHITLDPSLAGAKPSIQNLASLFGKILDPAVQNNLKLVCGGQEDLIELGMTLLEPLLECTLLTC
jgi:hypothetical protein